MYITLYVLNNFMADTHSITEARRNLPSLIREAENGKALALTRRGKPVAVLVGRRQYEHLSAGRRSFQEAYRHFAQVTDLAELALDPDALFDDTRESIPERDIRF